jgi:WD40 repeat protein
MFAPARFMCFNDDYSSFTYMVYSSYSVYQCSPFHLLFTRPLPGLSVGYAVTCQGHRFFAFTGLPADPDFDTRQVCVFDHNRDNPNMFRQSFDRHVLSLRLTPSYLIIGFCQRVDIWDYNLNLPIIHCYPGISVFSPIDVSPDFKFLVIPGREPETVSMTCLSENRWDYVSVKGADDIVAIARFSRDGRFLATSNADGRVVRVFETEGLGCIGNLKRGTFATVIYSLDFSPNGDFLAVVSQNGTIHFFDLRGKTPVSSPPTLRAFQKITLDKTSVSCLMWANPETVYVMVLEGVLLGISIQPQTCDEVGRESVPVLRRIIEES